MLFCSSFSENVSRAVVLFVILAPKLWTCFYSAHLRWFSCRGFWNGSKWTLEARQNRAAGLQEVQVRTVLWSFSNLTVSSGTFSHKLNHLQVFQPAAKVSEPTSAQFMLQLSGLSSETTDRVQMIRGSSLPAMIHQILRLVKNMKSVTLRLHTQTSETSTSRLMKT